MVGALDPVQLWDILRPWALGASVATIVILVAAEAGRILSNAWYLRIKGPLRWIALTLLGVFALGIVIWVWSLVAGK